MQLADQATQGAKWTGLASALNALMGVAQIAIVARFLEPSDFGTVAMIMVILAIANAFVTVGFSDVLVVKHEATEEQLATMYWLNVIVGIAIYGLLFLGAPLVSMITDRDGIELMVRVMGLTLLLGACTVQFNALMRRELYLKALAVISLVASSTALLTSVILATTGFGIWSLIMAGLTSQMVTNVGLLFYAQRFGWFPKCVFNISVVVEMIRFGTYRIGAALLNAVITRSDQLAIGAFLGSTALGFYTVAYNLAMQPFNRINPILTQVSFPVFSKIKDDNDKLLRVYRKGLRLLMVINAPLLIGMIAVAPLLIPALLGQGWEKSIYVVQILSISVLFRSANNINIGLILAKEKYRWPLFWNLALLAIIPSTVIVAAKLSQSLYVVSWTIVVVQVVLSIMGYLLFARRLLGDFTRAYISDFGRPILTAVLMGIGVMWLRIEVDLTSHWHALILAIFTGIVLYIGLSFVAQRKHIREFIILAKGKM